MLWHFLKYLIKCIQGYGGFPMRMTCTSQKKHCEDYGAVG